MMLNGKDRKKEYNTRNRRLLIVLAAILLLTLTTGGLIAKYTTQNKREAQMIAADFHISSNYLTAEGGNYTVSDWGNHGIDIQLYNYETENIALVAKEDIYYKVTAEEGWNVSVKTSDDAEVTPTDGTYRMPGGGDAEQHNFQTIHLEYIGESTPPDNVTVTVETTDPYVKKLTAKFILHGLKVPDYKIEDKGNYCLITIHTNDYEDGIAIKWNEKFSPDNTNPKMAAWSDANREKGETLSVESYETYELIFVKNTDDKYSTKTGNGTTVTFD